MIDYQDCQIDQIAVHKVGNKTNEEQLYLSKNLIPIEDERLEDLLRSYFLKNFPMEESYHFSFSDDDLHLNPVYNYSSEIFADQDSLYINSVKIAKHLYEVSTHPNIKSGDLFIVHFSEIELNGEQMQALGIFKSENRQSFLKVEQQSADFALHYEDGINLDKMDKGCLIFDCEKEEGFKVFVVDKSNRNIEAQYWYDDFLHLKSAGDAYNHTKDFLDITKKFVTKQISNEFEVEKTDKIDLLNRSVDYFKKHDSFDKEEFETEVFVDENVIESFRNFDESYRQEHEMSVVEDFSISNQAVKKQERAFKSVLKLDKNFHVYIHGNKDMIAKGVESDGRKFYKIYYENEQ